MKPNPTIPRIVFSELGRRWYCVTKYTERIGLNLDTGEDVSYMRAQIKHDITDQMERIINADRARKVNAAPWRKRDNNRRQSGGRRNETKRGRDDNDGRRQT